MVEGDMCGHEEFGGELGVLSGFHEQRGVGCVGMLPGFGFGFPWELCSVEDRPGKR